VNLVIGTLALSGLAAAMPDPLPSHDASTSPQCMVQAADLTWTWTDCPAGQIGGFVPYEQPSAAH
jgi:hypothetical protein